MRSYSTVTELPGAGVTPEQLAMLFARYDLAAGRAEGKDVLEVACGPGVGLGYLARRARRIVGGDYDAQMLRLATAHYGDRIPVLRLDAHALPFTDHSFDVVILFEALYYLPAPARFVAEAHRVLRPGGMILISTVNRDWPGFNPSPFSVRYFSLPELRSLLNDEGFVVELLGGFPVNASTPRDWVVEITRRFAIRLHLIPSTMKGKQLVKRLVYGRLASIPRELQNGSSEALAPVPLAGNAASNGFKILYAIGQR